MAKGSSSKVRVLLIGPVPPPYGGIATYVKDLSEACMPGVEIVSLNTTFPTWVAPADRHGSLYRESLARNGLLVTLKIVLYVLWTYPYLAYRIVRDRADIVQVFPSSHWSYWRNWLYVLLAKAMGRKAIFHLLNAIDLFYGRVGRFRKWLLRLSFKSADVYLVQSSGLQKWLQQYCRKPCYGFLNGIHLDRVPAASEAPHAVSELPKPVGLTIGALGRHKGTPQILEALSRLRRSGRGCGWVFVGMGEVTRYQQLAESLGVADSVLFTGAISEDAKWRYLLNADFYCLASDAEGQPISILEAMAARLPVIATAVGSTPEIISEGETGYTIPVADPGALEQAMLSMMEDERRKRMGAAARRYLVHQHNIRRLFEALGDVYRGLEGRSASST